jgi:nitronate monooxygenase
MDATQPSSSALRTPLCDLLGMRYPIIQAPMAGGLTTPELVAAVSNAGGLGMLAASGLSAEQTRALIQATRALTTQPFGVNFLIAPAGRGNRDVAATQRFLDRFRQELGLPLGAADLQLPPSEFAAQLEIVYAERVPILSFALGDPGPFVVRAHAIGTRVVAMVTTVAEALCVAEAGVDVIVAQGAEAGGHRSTFPLDASDADGTAPLVGTLALVPQVVDTVGVPVVAAGGIMDGRGVVAALALGAGGAQLGTRFLLARESGASSAYKERLLAAAETDTVVTRAFTGRPARALRNRFVEEYERAGTEPLIWPLQRAAAQDIYGAAQAQGNLDYSPVWAGQGLRLAQRDARERSAAEIVAELATEVQAELARLCHMSG